MRKLRSGSLLMSLSLLVGMSAKAQLLLPDFALDFLREEPVNQPLIYKPLADLRLRSTEHMWSTVGVKNVDSVKGQVSTLHTWYTSSRRSKFKKRHRKLCKLSGEMLSNHGWKPSPDNLACLPVYLEFFAESRQALERALSDKSSRQSTRKRRGSSSRITNEAQWKRLKGLGFREAYWRLRPKNEKELNKVYNIAQKFVNDCSYRSATTSLFIRAEEELPNRKAWKIYNSLFSSVEKCLPVNADNFERTFQRAGLVFTLHNKFKEAKHAFQRSLKAQELSETHRTLFWLGFVSEKLGEDPKTHWNELIKKHPLKIHAVIASHAMGKIPFENEGKKAEPLMVNRRTSQDWVPFDTATFLLEFLVAEGKETAAKQLSQFIIRKLQPPTKEARLFAAWLHGQAGNYFGAILNVTRYLKAQDEKTLTPALLSVYFPMPYRKEVLSVKSPIDPLMIYSLMRQESAFHPHARSGKNARGLMQLLPRTASQVLKRRIRGRELYKPIVNITAGTRYLKEQLEEFRGDFVSVLAAYNAGPRPVRKWKLRYLEAAPLLFADLIPYSETRSYVALILRNAYWYGRRMRDLKGPKTEVADTLNRLWNLSQKAGWTSREVAHLLTDIGKSSDVSLIPNGDLRKDYVENILKLPTNRDGRLANRDRSIIQERQNNETPSKN